MCNIDPDFISMICLLTNAATNNNLNIGDFDEKKVLKYAEEQSVLPLVCSALNHSRYGQIILGAVAKNISDLSYIRRILDELQKNDIDFVVLKGDSVAAIYTEPDLRISGDVDILLDRKDEERALDIFSGYGYSYTKRPEWGNETVLIHPTRKQVEIHVDLYDKSREDIFFGKVGSITEPYMKITTDNLGEIKVLSPNDGIMFLYLHFVKHFLSSGAGIRQLLDIVLYSRYYKDKIKWEDFFEKLESVHYLQLYSYILSAAVKYMGFKQEDLPHVNYDFNRADKVVADLQHSGIFGHNEADLARFKRIYEKRRNEKYGFVDYDEYEKMYNVSKIKVVFPPLPIMQKKYKYLEKHSYLLPAAWLQRIAYSVWGIVTKKNKLEKYTNMNTAITNQTIENRMKLMEELDII